MLDSGLFTVGCHTHSQQTELVLDPDVLSKDVEESLATLHDHLGVEAHTFADPEGPVRHRLAGGIQPRFELTFAGEGLQTIAMSDGQPLRRIGITKDFTRPRLPGGVFSPFYWKARHLRGHFDRVAGLNHVSAV